ncbi:MAG: 6-hydroxymethylpterin diphosphokinase MptE-like protein [Halarcobacter sp.]
MSLEKSQEQLQKILIETYFSNLEFLKQFDKNLFNRVEQLSSVINSGLYPERYFLEFIQDVGEFDIYDSHTKEYLYKKNPKKINHKLVNDIKLDKSSYFSSMLTEPYDLKLESKEINMDYETYEDIEYLIVNDMKKFTQILKDDTLSSKSYKYVEKFIFMGTLLGRHILDAHKKIKAKSYFICEDNLEVFRLSLFVINYVEVYRDSKLTLSIMDDENIFITKYQLFLEQNPDENYYIKYCTTNYNVSSMMQRVISTMYKTNPMVFDYTRVLYNLVKLTSQRVNKDNILTISKKRDSFNFAEGKPVIFVAAGPSLQDNISWLKSNQNKFIVVAIGASYKMLLKNGITPDIISTIEPSFRDLKKFHFTDEDLEKLQETIILASVITPEQLTNKFNKEKVFYFEINNSFKSNSTPYKGYSVGELTVAILLHLGIEKLYLLGTDLAINSKTGETHFSDYKDLEKKDIKEKDSNKSLKTTKTTFKDDLVPVKGNFNDEVLTTRIFIMSIFAYMQILQEFKKENQKVINLSDHGAYLEGTIPLKIEELDLTNNENIDKKVLNNFLVEKLNEVSENRLTQEELEGVKKEIAYFDNLVFELKNDLSRDINSFKDLKSLMYDTEQSIKKIGYPTLMNYLMEQYSKFANLYICYHFNDKKLKNEFKKIKAVKEVWLKQVINLLEQYLKYLKNMIDS